jgi:hypothetical protein
MYSGVEGECRDSVQSVAFWLQFGAQEAAEYTTRERVLETEKHPPVIESMTLDSSGSLYRSVDTSSKMRYNRHMDTKNTPRKKRTDRNHIIYELRVNGLNYIGVTAKTESTINKSVLARAAKHFYRAKTETKNWLLCQELRKLTDKSEIEVLIHEVIRGKAQAHKREVELRRMLAPTLNTDTRGD